MATFKASIF